MGEFLVQLDGEPVAVANMTHREGITALWRTAFEGGAPPSFRIGLSGLAIPNDPRRRPDHTADAPQPLFWVGREAGTRYADVTRRWFKDGLPHALNGGALDFYRDGAHRSLMAYSERPVSVGVRDEDPCSLVESEPATWTHAGSWEPPANPLTGEPGAWLPESPPAHGWPWQTPIYPPGSLSPLFAGRLEWISDWQFLIGHVPAEFRTGCWVYVDGTEGVATAIEKTSDGWVISVSGCLPDRSTDPVRWTSLRCSRTLRFIERRPWAALSGPVNMVWIACGDPGALVASAMFREELRIPPGGGLTASYRSCVSCGSMSIAATRALCRRIWLGPGAQSWGDWAFGLGETPAEQLTRHSTLTSARELGGDGYARVTATGWTIGPGGEARLGAPRPCFANLSSIAWPRARCLFAVSRFGAGDVELACWWPIDVTLNPGDTVVLSEDAAVLRLEEEING